MRIEPYRNTRYWAVLDEDGTLVCLCAYRKGTLGVVRSCDNSTTNNVRAGPAGSALCSLHSICIPHLFLRVLSGSEQNLIFRVNQPSSPIDVTDSTNEASPRWALNPPYDAGEQ